MRCMTESDLNPRVNDSQQSQSLSSAIRSDELPRLRQLLTHWAPLREVFGNLLQLRLVVDANIAYAELIWRVCKRRNPAAQTGLLEAIISGTIIAFAPPALEWEIQEHLPEIAERGKVPVSSVLLEWQSFKAHIHFYEPEPPAQSQPGCPDPDDLPYKLLCEQLGAHAVYSRDSHLRDMSVPVICVQVDLTARDYARASAVRLTLFTGTTFSAVIGFGALIGVVQACRACLRTLGQLPTAVKLLIAVGALLVMIHPKLRAKVAEFFQSVASQFNALKPALGEVLSTLMTEVAEADTAAKKASAELQSYLPASKKRPVVVMARRICLVNEGPLSLQELEIQIRREGFVTKAKNFPAYLRRVLRNDERFTEVSPGHWTVMAERLALKN
jgi:predicted nucleic acid-binding protein